MIINVVGVNVDVIGRGVGSVYDVICKSLDSIRAVDRVVCQGFLGRDVGFEELGRFLPAVFVGGDHSSTLVVLRLLRRVVGGGVGLVVFDAHFDAGSGGVLPDSWLRVAVEEGLVGCVFHVGSVEVLNEPDEEEFLRSSTVFEAYRYEEYFVRARYDGFTEGLRERFRGFLLDRCGCRYWYVSMDADYIDSPYVIYPESPNPLGVAPVDALMHLRIVLEELARSGAEVLGFDLTEFAGAKEPGVLPATLAAAIVFYAGKWLRQLFKPFRGE